MYIIIIITTEGREIKIASKYSCEPVWPSGKALGW